MISKKQQSKYKKKKILDLYKWFSYLNLNKPIKAILFQQCKSIINIFESALK